MTEPSELPNFAEGCGKIGPLRGILLCEFHPTQGPMIRIQAPSTSDSEVVTKDAFDCLSHYVIPKALLAMRTVTVNALGYKILGYPIIIEDTKYARNQYMFNICFVVYPWSRSIQFEAPLKKLSDYLVNLEVECQYLSKAENSEKLTNLLDSVFSQLRSSDFANITVENYSLQLKISKANKPDPPTIKDHHVPILIRGSVNGEDDDFFKDSEDEDSSSDETAEGTTASASGTAASVTTASDATASRTTAEASDVTASRITASGTAASENRTPYTRPNGSENKHLLVRSQSQVSDSFFKRDRDKWDLTTQQIIPHINGLNCVAKIAHDAGVDPKLVKVCVQNLVYQELVGILSIFQFCNSYVVTPKITELQKNPRLKKDFLKIIKFDEDGPDVIFKDAFRFTCDLYHGTTIRDLVYRFKPRKAMNINEVQLVNFLCLKGIIRRVHKLPYLMPENHDGGLAREFLDVTLDPPYPNPFDQIGPYANQPDAAERRMALRDLLNGNRSYDEICVKTGLCAAELDESIEGDVRIFIIRK